MTAGKAPPVKMGFLLYSCAFACVCFFPVSGPQQAEARNERFLLVLAGQPTPRQGGEPRSHLWGSGKCHYLPNAGEWSVFVIVFGIL